MNDDRRHSARRRYLSLGTGELAAAGVFALLAGFVVAPRFDHREDAMALWSALIPLLLVLVQAGAYWLLARSWVLASRMPVELAALYSVFRVLNVALLAASLAATVLWQPSSLGVGLLCLGVWLFGAIEYLNYFVVRLSYPLAEWFATVTQRRVPRLMKDVRAAGAGVRRVRLLRRR